MNAEKMNYCDALIEWSGGGLKDVPTENMKDMYIELIKEFKKRGYSVSGNDCIKNPVTGDFIAT